MRKLGADVGYNIGLAVLYVATARVGTTFDAIEGFAAVVWPPTGVSLVALLLFGNRLWPGVFVGAIVANIFSGAPILVALGIGVGNTGEALAGAYMLRRVRGFRLTLESARSVIALITLGGLLATTLSASIGVIALHAAGIVPTSELRHTWRAWWVGDIVGALVITPVILVWSRRPLAPSHQHWIETFTVSAAIVVAILLSFFGDLPYVPSLNTRLHEATVLLVVLLWATLRFGQRGAATASFCVSAAAVVATVLGHGPLAQPETGNGLLSLQAFMAIVAATFLLFGAHVSELRLALEDARRAEEAAQRANMTKSEFLAVMSHELRTPLNAIAGYAELLKEGIHGSLTDKQREDVERIQRNEKQLLSQIEEIFGFVSAEKGEVMAPRQTVYLDDTFDAVEPMVRAEFREHRCELRRSTNGSRLAVRADAKSLERILASLLSNASKFCGERGVVTIGADRGGDVVRIWVHDSGPGISKEEIQRVFEPFFQTDRGLTRRTSGIGLGLTIARHLARRMEGEVTLESRDGGGTTASVVLPAADGGEG